VVPRLLVVGEHGPTVTLEAALRQATGGSPVIEISDREALRAQVNRSADTALALGQALLGMAVLVAALGVVNTMAMSVFERRRETALLRAVGLDRRGVGRTVRVESALICLLGAVAGTGLGAALGWAAVRTTVVVLPDITVQVPYGRLLLFLAGAVLVGVLAAAVPARRAARGAIVSGLAAE
jgi:putative ABC transport system permease protein